MPTAVTRIRSVCAGRPVDGIDQVVLLDARAPPAPAVAAGGGETAVRQAERQGVVDGDRPRPFGGDAAHGDVPAGTDEGGSRQRKQLRDALGGEPLADAAEVELEAGLELDPPAGERHAAADSAADVAAADRRLRTSSKVRS